MKAITKKQFRVLLTAWILLMLASVLAAALDSRLLPQPLLNYLQSQQGKRPKGGELFISLLSIPGGIAGLMALIGLYRFWPHARWLGLASWTYMLIWMPFSPDPVVSNTLSAALSDCSILLAGVILGIIYFSPAAQWFQKEGLSHDG